ncbi:MAG: putative ABC transporter permease subunit [bacterium]
MKSESKDLFILLLPLWWSFRNDVVKFHWSFYRKLIFYLCAGILAIVVVTLLMSIGMEKLQTLSPEVFRVLLIKGFSLIFIIIFLIQIINGFIVTLKTFYQSPDLEGLFISPVSRTSLFFARLFETHVKASWMLVIFGIPVLVSLGRLFNASLLYYGYALILFAIFFTIPVHLGASLAFIMANIFHIRKMKKFILSAAVVSVALLTLLFRLFKPERFVNPELFANLTLFISEVRTPAFILLPNRWLSEAVFHSLNRNYIDAIIFIALLFLTSYISALLLYVLFRKYHNRGWHALLAGEILSRKGAPPGIRRPGFLASGFLKKVPSLLGTQSGMIISKDIVYQTRDVKALQHFLVIFSLIIVYLFSIASLPLNWEQYALRLKYTIAFFNLGLVLIILAALSARLVYPSILTEGHTLWLIRTAPITARRFIWTKFCFFLLPLFISGQLLNIFSLLFIDVERIVVIIITLATAASTFSLVSMSIAFGASDMRMLKNEGAGDPEKTANALYMIISLLLVLLTLAIEIVPIYLYFLKESAKMTMTGKGWAILAGTLALLISVHGTVTAVAIRSGIKKIRSLELS